MANLLSDFHTFQISATLTISEDRRQIQSITVINNCNTRAYVTVPSNAATGYVNSEVYAGDRTLFTPIGNANIALGLEYTDGLPAPTTQKPTTAAPTTPLATTAKPTENGGGAIITSKPTQTQTQVTSAPSTTSAPSLTPTLTQPAGSQTTNPTTKQTATAKPTISNVSASCIATLPVILVAVLIAAILLV